MRRHPHLFEANAFVLVRRLSEKYNKALTLATIPQKEWQKLAGQGFDMVWIMGVWQRSPSARRQALVHPELKRAYDTALPGWKEYDVSGSPYAVYDYFLDYSLGEEDELLELKRKLNRLGISLILDFIPNHVATDHPWISVHPNRFVQGVWGNVEKHPDWFFHQKDGLYVAHGRDPNFPPWSDTAQVNFFSSDLREAFARVFEKITRFADGVRCDMAMLGLNRVFERVWGEYLNGYARPREEFWPFLIGRVHKMKRNFMFLAEVYWNMEWELQQMGFDYTYDKTLYDRLRHAPVPDIRSHLLADPEYQRRSARFIENHDEERAHAVFGTGRSLAASVVMSTLPGLRFFHDGQMEGKKQHLPIQLSKEPHEPTDPRIFEFYDRLLATCDLPIFHDGEWTLLEAHPAWEGNWTNQNLLTWCWKKKWQIAVVVVNYSSARSQGRVMIPAVPESGEQITLHDRISGESYTRGLRELQGRGLYVELDAWRSHVLTLA